MSNQMRSIKVTFADGNVISTAINGTDEEIKLYYLGAGQVFNIGDPHDPTKDNVQKAVKVEFLH